MGDKKSELEKTRSVSPTAFRDYGKGESPDHSTGGASTFLRINRLFRNRMEQPAWHATLRISAANVARLVATGFKWSHECILEGHDRIVFDNPTLAAEDGMGPLWRHTRIYQLKDKEDEPEYKGILHVYGRARETVLNFDPSQITTGTLIEAKAWDWDGNNIYYANKRSGFAFNKVYNTIPLRDWWPAPRGPGDELKGWKLLPRS